MLFPSHSFDACWATLSCSLLAHITQLTTSSHQPPCLVSKCQAYRCHKSNPCFPKEPAREVPVSPPSPVPHPPRVQATETGSEPASHSGGTPAREAAEYRIQTQVCGLHHQGCTLPTMQPLPAPTIRSDHGCELRRPHTALV